MNKIPAKVAAVLTDSIVALNIGSDNGVSVDDKANVLRRVEINDPDTHERLGEVGVIVLQLRVSHTQEKLCTAHVTSYQDDAAANVSTRVRRFKKIVKEPLDEKAGVNVYVEVGDIVNVEVKDSGGFSDEPPF
jgi:hypothetical protein